MVNIFKKIICHSLYHAAKKTHSTDHKKSDENLEIFRPILRKSVQLDLTINKSLRKKMKMKTTTTRGEWMKIIGKIIRLKNKIYIFIHFKHVSLKDNENNSILSPNVQTMTMPIDVDIANGRERRRASEWCMEKSILIWVRKLYRNYVIFTTVNLR